MATNDTYKILNALQHRGIELSFDDANILRRAELTLRAWFTHECNGVIQRDEETGVPYYHNPNYRYIDLRDPRAISRAPDREKGARARIAEVCARNNLHYYIQGDPRGCALYVSNEPLTDSDYNRGVACCA